jgi:hypothetical protein
MAIAIPWRGVMSYYSGSCWGPNAEMLENPQGGDWPCANLHIVLVQEKRRLCA